MALYGYARVSTSDQDFTLQEQALRAAGCQVIRAEKVSATRREGRTELALLLEFLRHGDTLVVTRIDRLARSIKDLQDIVHLLKERGVTQVAAVAQVYGVSSTTVYRALRALLKPRAAHRTDRGTPPRAAQSGAGTLL